MTNDQIADMLEELNFLRSGKPFHTHRWTTDAGEHLQRCSSPYCSTLLEPKPEEVHRA
jgi:hypothetical protein